MKEIQKILSRVRLAVEKYDMIAEGDKIAVGVSGGKDSLTLLLALDELSKFLPRKFETCAVTVDMGFDKCKSHPADKGNYDDIKALCEARGIEYVIKETELASIIFDERKESNPCSLCSRMRRGILHDTAKEIGANKVALGHHFDDVVETFMLNLFFEGRIGSFSPVTRLGRKEMDVIRPLVMTEEKLIKAFAKQVRLPVTVSPCPEDKNTEREKMKDYLFTFERQHRGLYRRIFGALERGEIDGWHE